MTEIRLTGSQYHPNFKLLSPIGIWAESKDTNKHILYIKNDKNVSPTNYDKKFKFNDLYPIPFYEKASFFFVVTSVKNGRESSPTKVHDSNEAYKNKYGCDIVRLKAPTNVTYKKNINNTITKWDKVNGAYYYVVVFNTKYKNSSTTSDSFIFLNENQLIFGKNGKVYNTPREYKDLSEISFSVYAVDKNECGMGYQSEIKTIKY